MSSYIFYFFITLINWYLKKCHRVPCPFPYYIHIYFLINILRISSVLSRLHTASWIFYSQSRGPTTMAAIFVRRFIYTRVNLQTVIKSQRTSIVTAPRPVNQRWKTGEYSSATSQFSALLVEPEFEIQWNIISFPFFPDNHLYLLMELPTPIRERAKRAQVIVKHYEKEMAMSLYNEFYFFLCSNYFIVKIAFFFASKK